MTLKCRKNWRFVVFDAISVQFPEHSVLISITINSTRKERPMHYIFGRLSCSVLLQKHFRKISTTLFLSDFNLCTFWIVLESEGCQTVNKDWTDNPVGFYKSIVDFSWKMAHNWPQIRKCRIFRRFLTFSVNFYLRLENFGWKKLQKAPDDETRLEAHFSKTLTTLWSKVSSEWPKYSENWALSSFI